MGKYGKMNVEFWRKSYHLQQREGEYMQRDLLLQAAGWQPYSLNTFSGSGKSFQTAYPVHHVRPHYVQAHFRDGKYISEYWRDGDGNTSVNTYRGYYAKNPNAAPVKVLLGKSGKKQ